MRPIYECPENNISPLADGTPVNICIYFIFLETKIMGLHFVADSIFLIFIAD